MLSKTARQESSLSDFAVAWLRDRLPARWQIDPQAANDAADASIQVRGDNGAYTTLTVEAKQRVEPRDVERMFGSLVRRLRASSPHLQFLVVAPWLSARTRELLEAENVNYIDMTGNALVRLDNPAVFVRTDGAPRAPTPPARAASRVRGPKAGRLIRTLVDVAPPYGVSELASATGLTAGYVSRLLDALDSEALVDRGPRGRVSSVDVAALLRRWTETYDLFSSNDAATFLSGIGAPAALSRLAELKDAGRTAVTGSFAAVRLAPVAGPALLCVYCESPATVADALDLLPTDTGPNVALLTPFDNVVWQRTSLEEDVQYVAPSQAAVDCLTGNGRMPAEGQALLDWMLANEPAWRLETLPQTEETAE